MDASKLPKGQSGEANGDGRLVHEPGVYVHKESGAKFITAPGEEGVVQADALFNREIWLDGWERVGDVPTRLELLEMQKAQAVKDAAADALQKGKEAAEHKAAVKEATEVGQAKIDEQKITDAKTDEAKTA